MTICGARDDIMNTEGGELKNALIVTSSEKSVAFFSEMLHNICCDEIVVVDTGKDARRVFAESGFDVCIVNAPIEDEDFERLAVYLADFNSSQVILVVKGEVCESVNRNVEGMGVITVAVPVGRALFHSVLKAAAAFQSRIGRFRNENSKLLQKIEDTRIISRAKLILVTYLSMSEPQAHRYIEKQAMDKRISKRKVAEGILKVYEY